MFRKIEFDMIYYAIQVLYKHFRGGWGIGESEAMVIFLGGGQNSGKPAYIILPRSLSDEMNIQPQRLNAN